MPTVINPVVDPESLKCVKYRPSDWTDYSPSIPWEPRAHRDPISLPGPSKETPELRVRRRRLRLRYYQQGNGKNLITFVHGHGSGLEDYNDVYAAWPSNSDWTLLAVDLPCAGESPHPSWFPESRGGIYAPDLDGLSFLVDVLDTFHAWWLAEHGSHITGLRVVGGASLGGNLALGWNQLSRFRVDRAVAWSPASVWRYRGQIIYGAEGARAFQKGRNPGGGRIPDRRAHFFAALVGDRRVVPYMPEAQIERWWHPSWPSKAPFREESIRFRERIYSDVYCRVSWQIAAEELEFSHWRTAHLYETPTLVIVGQTDNFKPECLASNAYRLWKQRLNRDRYDFLVFGDTGHSIHNERPKALVRTMLEWLEG